MQPKLPALIAAVTATFTFAASAAAQSPADHLKCFQVKDPQVKSVYVADLAGLITETGCQIKVPAAMVCVPASKTNVQPTPPGAGATGRPNAFGCYKVKCPKLPKGTVLPTFGLDDQFGSRTVTAKKSSLLCAPAVPTASSCIEPFDATLQIALDLLTHGLDASGNLSVPASCGASPALCCPGGTSITPCGPLHIELTSAAIDAPPAADRLDLTYRMRVATVTDIPVTIPIVGDCGMQFDSTAGTSPTVRLDVPVNLTADHLHILEVGTINLTDVESGDFALTGGGRLPDCQLRPEPLRRHPDVGTGEHLPVRHRALPSLRFHYRSMPLSMPAQSLISPT